MNLIYLILIVMLFVYNITGIYLLIPLILAILNFIVATLNLTLNPNIYSRFVQIISLAFIAAVILLNIYQLFLIL